MIDSSYNGLTKSNTVLSNLCYLHNLIIYKNKLLSCYDFKCEYIIIYYILNDLILMVMII
jgi:hypothetical protein